MEQFIRGATLNSQRSAVRLIGYYHILRRLRRRRHFEKAIGFITVSALPKHQTRFCLRETRYLFDTIFFKIVRVAEYLTLKRIDSSFICTLSGPFDDLFFT